MNISTFDSRSCDLGEGPLWHPLREQLFWFDIVAGKMLSQYKGQPLSWSFDEAVSAAGWIDKEHLLIASASALLKFNIESNEQEVLCPLEADNKMTRSNDGRADPFGGFWIGTMGYGGRAQPQEGAIYRYYKGELRQLFDRITIPNAICFDPKGKWAYFTDTAKATIWRQQLHAENGWPKGDKELYLDLRSQNLNPDGAVCDQLGRFWVAIWGSSKVACFDERGELVERITLPATQPSCPAFGGSNLNQLFITSATQDMNTEQLEAEPFAGQTLVCSVDFCGQAEHRVLL